MNAIIRYLKRPPAWYGNCRLANRLGWQRLRCRWMNRGRTEPRRLAEEYQPMIDDGIDTGPVILSRRYRVAPEWSFEAFRANLYARCGETAVEAIRVLSAAGARWRDILQTQNEDCACYRPPIPDDVMDRVRESLPGWQPTRWFPEIGQSAEKTGAP